MDDSGHPVVAPRRGGPGCDFLWTFDPAVVTEPDGSAHLYYGSYYGGVQVRDLDVGGLTTNPATATQIVIPNRYEGSFVVRRGGWYYLMGSATDCCRGTPVISMNGNRWVGPGHNSVVTDEAGQDWFAYHAIDRNTVIGLPGPTTWLRIVRRGDRYTGCSSLDGRRWVRGGTWTHDLGGARLALFAMGGPGGHVAEFDYVRVARPAG